MATDSASSPVEDIIKCATSGGAGWAWAALQVSKHGDGDKSKVLSSDDVKKAYRKRALLCHPDKSDHPQAAEVGRCGLNTSG